MPASPSLPAPSTEPEKPAGAVGRGRAWMLAIRPRTLPAAVAPVIVGAALAARAGALRPLAASAALLAALLIQIGANLANDLGDFQRGADAPERVGPVRVTSSGLLAPREVLAGAALSFGLAALFGLYLIAQGGWLILLLGLLAIAAAIGYTAGPLPFGYYGLGDLAVFAFFGPAAVVGAYFVQAGDAPPETWLASLAMGALVTAILVVNNVRDIDTDRQAGKRTLVVRWGRRGGQVEYVLLLALAYAAPVVLWLGMACKPVVLLPLLTAPLAIRRASEMLSATGPALNRTLAATAQLAALYAIAFSLGIILS